MDNATMTPVFKSSLLYNKHSVRNVALILSVILIFGLYRTWKKLSYVSGPRLASISDIPRLLWARSGKAHETHIRLHEEYGSLVRLGPNSISVGDAREISKIYGIRSSFGKVSPNLDLFCRCQHIFI